MTSPDQAHEITVRTDIDIVNLRQTVRDTARRLGLSLSHQARVTAAVSTLAHSLLKDNQQAVFRVQVSQGEPAPALEIMCRTRQPYPVQRTDQLREYWHARDVCRLVDEFALQREEQDALLTVRIWRN
jgi:anti-sigma regulatory factor (Ser/Thr protein kinase)